MKHPWLTKLGALGVVILALLYGLHAIGGIVDERQGLQREAEQSVADALAGEQTVVGPVLRRSCRETWQYVQGEGKDSTAMKGSSDTLLTAWPRTLAVAARVDIEPRYRGLFKLNSYLAKAQLAADWADLAPLTPQPEHPGGEVHCEPVTVSVALSDARGIQAATVQAAGNEGLQVSPGSGLGARWPGFHAVLPDSAWLAGRPLHLDVTLNVAGTRAIAWVPVADDTRVQMASDWAHPSFQGRFLPVARAITDQGFHSQWQVSGLATTASQALQGDAALCAFGEPLLRTGGEDRKACIDSFGVSFIDPVSGYVQSDRALKYGLLFIALTFIGVASTASAPAATGPASAGTCRAAVQCRRPAATAMTMSR